MKTLDNFKAFKMLPFLSALRFLLTSLIAIC